MSDEKTIITPKTLKGDDGYRTFSIRVKEETVLKIEDISNRTGRSRNELIGILLEIGLDNSTVESTKKE